MPFTVFVFTKITYVIYNRNVDPKLAIYGNVVCNASTVVDIFIDYDYPDSILHLTLCSIYDNYYYFGKLYHK